ncbi:hypothetical protein GTW69_02385 [Streptomyces sp. SID7760]|nr:hypothetical protein [Streptomyces sp. SID7760]
MAAPEVGGAVGDVGHERVAVLGVPLAAELDVVLGSVVLGPRAEVVDGVVDGLGLLEAESLSLSSRKEATRIRAWCCLHRFLPCAEDVEACAPSGTRAVTRNTTSAQSADFADMQVSW